MTSSSSTTSFFTMDSPSTTTSSLSSFSSFLLRGLVPHKPSDMEDKCGICTATWNEDPVGVIKLPCGHVLHQECVMPWITEVKGMIATCPYCRYELCTRAWRAPEEDTEWIESRIDAIRNLAFNAVDAYLAKCAEGEGDWRPLFVEIFGQICTTEEGFPESRGAAEYLVVKAIMSSLERVFRAAGLETSEMQEVLEGFWGFEDQPEREEWEVTRDIEATYEKAGLVDLLVARWKPFYEC